MGTSSPLPITSATPLLRISGIGPTLAKKYQRLGLETAGDLLNFFPRRWDDFSHPEPIARLRPGSQAVIQGTILQIASRRSPQKRWWVTDALITDQSGAIRAVWFNQPYLTRVLRPKTTWVFAGGVVRGKSGVALQSPVFEMNPEVCPVYPETSGLTSKMIRRHMRLVLPLSARLPDPLPPAVVANEHLIPLSLALKTIHFPETIERVHAAKTRLAFDELFFIILRTLTVRQELSQASAPVMHINERLLRKFSENLPFTLTDAQRKAAWEIVQDLSKPVPMNRLLEGDVGSGKTVTAMFGVITAKANNLQSVWMAPTEILAAQHFETAGKLLAPMNLSVGIMTGTTKENKDADIVIGTHALLTQGVTFPRLGFLIVDEQHRFGVKQRAQLREKHNLIPHLLSMTATPIPRTLALALYGDLDLSILDEVPTDRKMIDTKIVPPTGREKAYEFIGEQIRQGRQAFVITPLIEPKNKTSPEEIERKSAVAEFEKLTKTVFPDLRIGLLHGKLSGKEKQAVMDKFSQGGVDILVSTAVVEVGIDVPNATVMVIEGAERFGLAQLHQLRGRVGRGKHQSYCFCFAESWSDVVKRRLHAFVTAKNGFELAELDLTLRGPGELTGIRQSGLPDLKMASLTDSFLIQRARRAAEQIMKEGMRRYPLLTDKLKEFTHARHLE
jgi:ATP-dependent DNA helicase RecG